MPDPFEHLGKGLVIPFRRDGKNDFAHGSGEDVVKSSLTIIMGTMCAGPNNGGEILFNQELGTLLPLLRHSNITDRTTLEMAKEYVIDSILKNEKRIIPRGIGLNPKPDTNRLILKLRYLLKEDCDNFNVKQSEELEEGFEV